MSVPPPGADGTMMRTVRTGKIYRRLRRNLRGEQAKAAKTGSGKTQHGRHPTDCIVTTKHMP